MNFSTASSITLPHPEEGAALLRGRLSPFLFGVPFRPGNLGLFGALLQPPAPEKKSEISESAIQVFFFSFLEKFHGRKLKGTPFELSGAGHSENH